MSLRPTVYLNGKFLAQRTTGVQRVACEWIRALDAQAACADWVLLCPAGSPGMGLRRIAQRAVGPRGLALHAWEQICLPWASRNGLLLSLSGSAPRLAARQIVTIHDAAVFDRPDAYRRLFVWWYRYLFRRLATRAERLLTVSEFSRDRLSLALKVPAARFAVVPGGADHMDEVVPAQAWLDSLALQQDGFLLAVGSLNPTKNLAALASAVSAAGSELDIPLVMVGTRRDGVFAAGQGPERSSRWRPLGWVDDAQLKALYGRAAGLIFPSTYEGFGLPPLEAMRSGCPVAAARIPALAASCGQAALFFDPDSPGQIAQALVQLATDRELREQLRGAGRAQAAKYRWADSARALLQALGPSL